MVRQNMCVVKDLEVYITALLDRADKRNALICRGEQYSKLLETESVDRPANYDDQIKEAERQRDHAKNLLKESQADLEKVMSDSELPIADGKAPRVVSLDLTGIKKDNPKMIDKA